MNKQDLLNRKAPQQTTTPTQRKLQIVVGAYIFNADKVLLIHHKKLDMWLPVGGHIEQNETPDAAVLREAKEEVNLDIEIICTDETPECGNMTPKLATPFHVNVHSVGDHDHCCLFYVCKVKNQNAEVQTSARELKSFEWFSKEQLNDARIPEDVKAIALTAFKVFEQANLL